MREDKMGLNFDSLHECYDDVPFGFTVIELVLDESGQPIDWIFRYLNDELARIEMVAPELLLNRYFYRDVFPNLKLPPSYEGGFSWTRKRLSDEMKLTSLVN